MEFGTAGQYVNQSVVVMVPVDTTMAVMCHVLITCYMLVHGSGCRCNYCMFSHSVDIGATISGILPLFCGDVGLFNVSLRESSAEVGFGHLT